MGPIEVRALTSIADLDATVGLQQQIWGYSELDSESRAILTVASRFSGQLLGAFSGISLVGFSLAFVALERECLHSHRVGVLPEFQNASVGKTLKLAQRDDALKLGFRSIHWTFDPCQPRNAYFNLRKLGGYVRSYLPNLYGTTSSPLHGGLPTDRLLIQWDLDSPRVDAAISGNPVRPRTSTLRIPLVFAQEYTRAENQKRLCESLQNAFGRGYAITDFEPKSGESGEYILEKL